MAKMNGGAPDKESRRVPAGIRAIGVTFPAEIVAELDHGLAKRGLFNCRSRAIAIAVRRFIDDGGLDVIGESATSKTGSYSRERSTGADRT